MNEPNAPVAAPPEPPAPTTLVCANCGAPLAGEYCSACGQRHEPHVHTVSHFAAEAFESISHADSRLWRTLWYLLSRPGFLTKEFFAGRRVAYLPPFRLYLVISVAFFVLAMPHSPKLRPESAATPAQEQQAAEAARELAAEAGKMAAAARKAARDADADPQGKDEHGVVIQSSGIDEFCAEFVNQPDSTNTFRTRLRDNCRALARDNGHALGAALIHNLPRAMFLFLPLLAGCLKIMYWRPKRYYVEHLLFLVHNHAFVFLAATLVAIVALIPWLGDSGWMGLLDFLVWLYIVWYIFRAMRNYYAQGRALTLVKYVFFGFLYVVLTTVMVLLTTLVSAMTM